MGSDLGASVVDKFGRSHDIPNLFCCDGSIFPTQGSANPGLTIQAMAARIAGYLTMERDNVLARRLGELRQPPVRHELSPPGVYTRGIPRIQFGRRSHSKRVERP